MYFIVVFFWLRIFSDYKYFQYAHDKNIKMLTSFFQLHSPLNV